MNGDYTAPMWTKMGADCDQPEMACALCAAYVKIMNARQVAVGGDGTGALQAIAAGALAASGVRVLQTGECTEQILQVLIPTLRLSGGIFISGQMMRFLDGQGNSISSRQMAAMDDCIMRQNAPPAFARPGQIIRFSGTEEIYLSRILPKENDKMLWSPIAVFCDSPRLRRLAMEGLSRMGAKDARCAPLENMELRAEETGFLLSENGKDITIFTGEVTPSWEQKLLLLLSLGYKKLGKIYDIPGVPRAAGHIAPLVAMDESEACNWQKKLLEDGLMALFFLCEAMKQGSLAVLMENLPETYIFMQDVPCKTRDKGRILHTLCRDTPDPLTLEEGIRIEHEKGYATIVPDAHRGLVRITSESANSEFAQELCDFYLDRIWGITGEKNPLQQ
jgi:phosphomannomutase